ncbi:T9SS type A sorting domain-containing protein [Chryseobacterium flavum]|uniref:T9SS type A sorting domain-containing protein n=1 Tax=Chryseobacterium flavum TaxID=415851 RepID=UPI002FDA8D1A
MKKTFLLFLITFVMSVFKAQSGGTDYIVILDNGPSMDNQRFSDMKLGATKLIEQLLSCNPGNRVAVVHYGAGKYGDTSPSYKPTLYIESDFTNNTFVGQLIDRRLDFGDHFHEALGLIGTALDGGNSPDIISSQTTLNRSPSAPLVVVVFSDAERNAGVFGSESYLVNYDYPSLNTPEAFKNVTSFKVDRQAKFAFIHLSTNSQAIEAAACIASVGGNYSGSMESNTDDPDYGILPRLYYGRTSSFGMSSYEVDYWSDLAGNICNATGWGSLSFLYEPSGCGTNGVQTINGQFALPAGAVLNGFKLVMRDNATAADYTVNFNPTIYGANQFTYQLQPSDFSLPSGTTGKFKFILTIQYSVAGGTYEVISWNGYPFFDYDINMDCTTKMAPKDQLKNSILTISPNPSDGPFKVTLDKEILSGKLEVLDVNNNRIFTRPVKGKVFEMDLKTQRQGIYIIKVTTDKNEVFSGKLIKK